MIYLIYSQNPNRIVELVRDRDIEEWAKDLFDRVQYDTSKIVKYIGQEIIVNIIRSMLDVYNPDYIQFLYEHENGYTEFIRHTHNGRLLHWPDGFCNYNEIALERLMAP